MYYLLSLLSGILISLMVAFNGGLTERYGIYSAAVIIHVIGLLFIAAIVLIKREKPFAGRHVWYLYLGGAVGVFTTVFNNFAFGRISVTAILALGLLGQSLSGIIIDQFGLCGMAKHPFSGRKLIGLSFILIGIAFMINSFELIAVTVSFISGVTIVTSRTLNGKLADLTSVQISTFFNYAVGLVGAVFIFLIIEGGEALYPGFGTEPFSSNWWIYFGGLLGVAVVYIINVVVVKISAFYLTLLVFVGQVFSGIVVDIIISGELSYRALIGGLLVAMGLSANLFLDKKKHA